MLFKSPVKPLTNFWKGFWGTAAEMNDGYGQSIIDDLRSVCRFRALRKISVVWQAPDQWPGDIYAEFPSLDRFGDGIVGWHKPGLGAEAETVIIIDRLWYGWPDPPEYAWLVFDQDGRIIAGCDFHAWPKAWVRSLTPPQ